jgi:DNA polymerase II small subunit
MADIRERYEDATIEEVIQACIDRGISVPLDDLDDRSRMLDLLHHDVNDLYARERTVENQLLRAPPRTDFETVSTPAPAAVERHDPLADAATEFAEVQRLHREKVRIVKNYTKPARKRTYDHFVRYFNKRYQAISAILRGRKELQSVVSISRVKGRQERETVSIIGMVLDKQETKGKHIVIKLEDPTGIIEVWLSANKHELLEIAKEVVLDEVIGIVGQTAGERMFASSVIFPDVPLSKELKKAPMETYVAFVGDVHVGAKLFLKDEFERFILWLSGHAGTPEQREIARKTEYVVFSGDLVEGIGIYPNQDDDLTIIDLKDQYREFAHYLKMIPTEKHIVITTGNHDAGRLQEPQLPIPKEFAPELHAMPNVTIVSNPAIVTIAQTPLHPGFDLLLYHGYSLIYYANNIPPVREAGGQKATEKIMQLLLRKRHLSPTHGCNTYVPDPDEDPMVIDRVPDFLITGHVHRISYANYRGVTMMNVGWWNEQSEEQEKRGLEPQPAKLPLVNLRTRELRIMNFYHGSEEKKQAMRDASQTTATAAPATTSTTPNAAATTAPAVFAEKKDSAETTVVVR